MNDVMEYKGYTGSVNYDAEDEFFFGKIQAIRSLISYEGRDAGSLRASFEEAVDDYLASCQESGAEPEAP